MDDSGNCVKDIRSPSVPHKRAQKAKQKYYGYRSHHPSIIGQPYIAFAGGLSPSHNPFNTSPSGIPLVTLGDKTCIRIWSKRDLWLDRLYNIWPLRPPHHYGRCRGCHPIMNKEQRGTKWARNVCDKASDEENAARIILLERYCDCLLCALDRFPDVVPSCDSLMELIVRLELPGENVERQKGVGQVERDESPQITPYLLAEGLGFEVINLDGLSCADSDEWSCIDEAEL